MDRSVAVEALRSHEIELRALGIAGLSLFGSTARGEAEDGSDVDLAVAFAPTADMDLFRFAAIVERLKEMLEHSVDLISEPARRPTLRDAIERDRVRVF